MTKYQMYRLYDATDRLLWVGVTENFDARVAAHRNGWGTSANAKKWAAEIARAEPGEVFDTRDEAAAAERSAIREELPAYNIQHHPTNKPNQAGSRPIMGSDRFAAILADAWTKRDGIDPDRLLAAIDAHREDLSYSEVANQVGTHRATFTRLKQGALPGPETLARMLSWLGASSVDDFLAVEDEPCPDCARAARLSVIPVPDAPADAICAHEGCENPPTHAATLNVGPGPDFIPVVGLYCAEHVLNHDREYTIIGSTSLPVADRDTSWDGSGAQTRIFDKFTNADGEVDTAGVAQGYLYRDPDADPTTKAAYKLPFADVLDGTLTIIPNGVIAAAGALAGGRGGVDLPSEDQAAAEKRVCTLYAKAKIETDCPFAGDSENPTDDGEGEDEAVASAAEATSNKTAAIVATGSLSDSEDPETQAAVTRVKELLTDGAVGVSIAHDMNPDDMPDPDLIDSLIAQERWDDLDALFENVAIRPRHVAIVDTPAFADARLTLNKDGTVTGPVVYEGVWTGDMRTIPYGKLVWDDVLPIPIIWDRHEGDHTGMTVGSVTDLERVDGETSPARTSDEAVAAAASGGWLDAIPASFFTHFEATAPLPVRVDRPDPTTGLRRVYGHAAPKGVCHRSDMGACFQYPGDVDPTLRHFHTGSSVTLDNGETVRVGALTLGGMHLDTKLARQGVTARDANRHREDANGVFALVHAWVDDYGLAMSGVVVPSVTDDQLARAMACAPSVELWPEQHGRTLVGIHLVPTPAWPVAASAGSATTMVSPAGLSVEMDERESGPMVVNMTIGADVTDRLTRIEKALALLVSAHAADGIDLPEPEPAK